MSQVLPAEPSAGEHLDSPTWTQLAWASAGLSLPLIASVGSVIFFVAITEPCGQIFCGLGTMLYSFVGGYLIAWICLISLAWRLSQDQQQRNHVRTVIISGAWLPIASLALVALAAFATAI